MGVDFFLKKKTNKFFRKIIFVTQMSNFSLFIYFFYQIGNRCSRLKEGTRPGEAPSNAKSRLDKKLFRACKDASFYNVATPFHAIPNVKAFFFSFHPHTYATPPFSCGIKKPGRGFFCPSGVHIFRMSCVCVCEPFLLHVQRRRRQPCPSFVGATTTTPFSPACSHM